MLLLAAVAYVTMDAAAAAAVPQVRVLPRTF
jgi:hypothetical protein